MNINNNNLKSELLDFNQLPYKINLTIGDWSGDGHNISQDYLFISNVPVERIREIHQDVVGDLIESTSFKALQEGDIDIYDCLREWIEAINKVDNNVYLKLISDGSFSSVNFFGVDSKGKEQLA